MISKSKLKSIQCAVCGQRFIAITKTHVALHGLSLAEYNRIYGATDKKMVLSEYLDKPLSTIELSDTFLNNPEIAAGLADGNIAHILGPKARANIMASVALVLRARLQEFNSYMETKAKIAGELFKDWRIKNGGEDGGPTALKDLLAMFSAVGQEQTAAETVIIKVLSQAVSERKAPMQLLLGAGLQGNAFTGRHEAVSGLNQQQREHARLLDECLSSGDPDEVNKGMLMAALITPEEYEKETGGKPTKKMMKAYDTNRKFVDVDYKVKN